MHARIFFLAVAASLLIAGCVTQPEPTPTPEPLASVTLSILFNNATPDTAPGKATTWEYNWDRDGWFIRGQSLGESSYTFNNASGTSNYALSVLEEAAKNAGFFITRRYDDSRGARMATAIDGVANGADGTWRLYVNGERAAQPDELVHVSEGDELEWKFE